MKTIERILEAQGFTPQEAEAFLDIINQAKLLQQTTQLEERKPYINKVVNSIARNDD
jgi:hypothetical protein